MFNSSRHIDSTIDVPGAPWNNAASPRTGGGAVERASLENWYMSAAPSDQTSETAKTYDDSGRDGRDALARHLRTDPDLELVAEAWPRLPVAIRKAVLALVWASG